MHIGGETMNVEYQDALLDKITKIRADPNICTVMQSTEPEPSNSTANYNQFDYDDIADDQEQNEQFSTYISQTTPSRKKNDRVNIGISIDEARKPARHGILRWFKYLTTSLLPTIPTWSKLRICDLSRHRQRLVRSFECLMIQEPEQRTTANSERRMGILKRAQLETQLKPIEEHWRKSSNKRNSGRYTKPPDDFIITELMSSLIAQTNNVNANLILPIVTPNWLNIAIGILILERIFHRTKFNMVYAIARCSSDSSSLELPDVSISITLQEACEIIETNPDLNKLKETLISEIATYFYCPSCRQTPNSIISSSTQIFIFKLTVNNQIVAHPVISKDNDDLTNDQRSCTYCKYSTKNIDLPTAVTISNLPKSITGRQLKESLNSIFNNTVKKVDIKIDIADYSTGIAYVDFYDQHAKNACLEFQANNRFIYLSNNLWKGPINIKEYTGTEDEQSIFKITMTEPNQVDSLALPRSNKHGRKRPYTETYDDLHGHVLRSYISVSYTEKYG
ncbi:unnamed protein product, partial [Rotaria sp. Silwood2]